MKNTHRFFALSTLAIALGSCRVGDIGGNVVRNAFGGGRGADIVAAGFQGAVDIWQQAAIRFSPEQEYYLGRALAANWIATYGLDPDEGRQEYVRKIGAAIVEVSGRVRGTYGGWHFGVLNGDRPNAMSAPGGFVFITRAAVDLAGSEDQLAGILAHEMAHVTLKHGEVILRESTAFKGRIAAGGRLLGAAGGGARLGQQMSELFSESADGLARSLAEQGYGARFESTADAEGSLLLYDAGYDGAGIQQYLRAHPERADTSFGVHGSTAERIAALEPIVAQYGGPFDGGAGLAARAKRFPGGVRTAGR
jgi:beta-barrel assembly-enhancing protease